MGLGLGLVVSREDGEVMECEGYMKEDARM